MKNVDEMSADKNLSQKMKYEIGEKTWHIARSGSCPQVFEQVRAATELAVEAPVCGMVWNQIWFHFLETAEKQKGTNVSAQLLKNSVKWDVLVPTFKKIGGSIQLDVLAKFSLDVDPTVRLVKEAIGEQVKEDLSDG